jgi:hypothetical protein
MRERLVRKEIQKSLKLTDQQSYKNNVIQLIKAITCNYYNSDLSIFDTKSRTVESVKTRHTAIYFCYYNLDIGPVELSKIFNCNYASIIHAIKKINEYIRFNKEYKNEIQEIQYILAHKGKMVDGVMNIDEDYYYINLSDVTTLRLKDGASVSFVGVGKESIEFLRTKYFKVDELPREHTKTGLYILKKHDGGEQEKG